MAELSLAHSPDADDLYMAAPFYLGWMDAAMAQAGVSFRLGEASIDGLNREAREGRHDLTALSFAAYPGVRDTYDLMATGASIQEGTGPLLVAARPLTRGELAAGVVAVPGTDTSSYLALGRWHPGLRTETVPFDRIADLVLEGRFPAGLIIDENQVDYARRGLTCLVDLGAWWGEAQGLPLPMGGMAIRASLSEPLKRTCVGLVREGVRRAMARHEACMAFVAARRPGVGADRMERHVRAWVNAFSVDPGERGRVAVGRLLGLEPRWIEAE